MLDVEKLFSRNDRTWVMGILNATPDSFYDAGRHFEKDAAVARAREMLAEGADVIDVGGESTRPGSEAVALEEELRRVIPVVKEISGEAFVSIDTMKSQVAEQAINAGARMINDVTAFSDAAMARVAREYDIPAVLMHMQGTPKTMQANPQYGDVVDDVKKFLAQRVEYARSQGVERVLVDPGIGFGKTLAHNLAIFRRLGEFKELGVPVLLGASRKSWIEKLLGLPPGERLAPSLAVAALAVDSRVDVLRVHDVKETVSLVKTLEAVGKA
jgi:dihydropteroate synthase